MILKLAFGLWLAGAGFDNATSYDFTKHYTPNYYQRQDGSWFQITEGNPIYAPLEHHPAAMSTAIAASDVVTAWAIHKWVEPHHPKAATVVYFALGGYRLALGANNMAAMRNADQAVRAVRVY